MKEAPRIPGNERHVVAGVAWKASVVKQMIFLFGLLKLQTKQRLRAPDVLPPPSLFLFSFSFALLAYRNCPGVNE